VPPEISVTSDFLQVRTPECQNCFFNVFVQSCPLKPKLINTLYGYFRFEARESRIASVKPGYPDFIGREHMLKCSIDMINQTVIARSGLFDHRAQIPVP
jgi:hypothetical protein